MTLTVFLNKKYQYWRTETCQNKELRRIMQAERKHGGTSEDRFFCTLSRTNFRTCCVVVMTLEEGGAITNGVLKLKKSSNFTLHRKCPYSELFYAVSKFMICHLLFWYSLNYRWKKDHLTYKINRNCSKLIKY